jgi:nucleoside-diphosphate-sugar epimerase
MKVFITGLNGFIASHSAAWLARQGHTVEGTSHSGGGKFRSVAWSLGDPVDPGALAGVDLLIHAAHDFRPGAMNANIKGTLDMERAAAGRVKRQILVSSLSALSEATSDYGVAKRTQEEHFLRQGHTIIRPGTVLGQGGLFGKIAGTVQRFPIVPLLDGGKATMTVIGVYDLCRALDQILRIQEPGQYNLYYEKMPTLASVVRTLAKTLQRRVVFVPVPSILLLLPLSALKALRIRTPIDVDNLKGYIASRAPDYKSDLRGVLPQRTSWESAIQEAWSKSIPAG